MIENILLGMSYVFEPYNLMICAGALFIGVLFGALPGFSATMGVAVFVPFSYVMEPDSALLLLSGIYCGVCMVVRFLRCSWAFLVPLRPRPLPMMAAP